MVDKLLSAVELASIVVRSDAVVSIPAHDSLSVSVLEAAAAGRPLVLSHIPANLVLCESGVRAQFVGHSEEAIAAGILVAIGETARHEALENVKVVREKYSWGHSVVHMTALYERVLRDSKPAATSTLS